MSVSCFLDCSVQENVHHIVITTLRATDVDSGYNGEVHYLLVEGDVLGDFVLTEDNDTGVCFLSPMLITVLLTKIWGNL